MARNVHLVGSVGLDTSQDVFAAVGSLLGPYVKRIPDGEPGGRRMWVTWQFPLLRGNRSLKVDRATLATVTGCQPLVLADGAAADEIHFGELGYAREARASYLDFLAARKNGVIAQGARFQVCLPTPFAVVNALVGRDARQAVEIAYEQAMIREVAAVCAAVPHNDLCIQWDICIEMLAIDGHSRSVPVFDGMKEFFAERFARLAATVPSDVELGFHLCYGDLDGKHSVEPTDSEKMVEMAHLIFGAVRRPIAYVHMPVPVERTDDRFFEPLRNLTLTPGTELYLGLVHDKDRGEGNKHRIATARKFVHDFGVAGECGLSRARSNEAVLDLLKSHAMAAEML